MKKMIFFTIITALIVFSCQTTSNTSNLTDISEAMGKEWRLIEVRVNNRNTGFNREELTAGGFRNGYTINIARTQISGTGAPNTYSAPYTTSPNDPLSVTIAVVRSTLMAPLNPPDKLKEHDFFIYIQNTHKWGMVNDKLELHSKTNSGEPVVLVFSL